MVAEHLSTPTNNRSHRLRLRVCSHLKIVNCCLISSRNLVLLLSRSASGFGRARENHRPRRSRPQVLRSVQSGILNLLVRHVPARHLLCDQLPQSKNKCWSPWNRHLRSPKKERGKATVRLVKVVSHLRRLRVLCGRLGVSPSALFPHQKIDQLAGAASRMNLQPSETGFTRSKTRTDFLSLAARNALAAALSLNLRRSRNESGNNLAMRKRMRLQSPHLAKPRSRPPGTSARCLRRS